MPATFTRMDESTLEDWMEIGATTSANQGRVADRMLELLRSLGDITDGFGTDQLTHCLQTATLAERAGADYLGTGALRSTSTKPDSRVIGLDGLRAVVEATRLPVVAIGGIRPDDVPAVRQAGAVGVAVASAVLQAPDVKGAAEAFLRALASS